MKVGKKVINNNNEVVYFTERDFLDMVIFIMWLWVKKENIMLGINL